MRFNSEIDMKLGPLCKIVKRNNDDVNKNPTMTSCRQVMTSLLLSGFLSDLPQPGRRIPDR